MLFVMQSYLIEVRGLKLCYPLLLEAKGLSYLIEVRGLKRLKPVEVLLPVVVPYRGAWIETHARRFKAKNDASRTL